MRDSNDPNNIDRAIDIFLLNESSELVVDHDTINDSLGGAYYGNLGRCYQMRGFHSQALNCYRKCVQLLGESTASNTVLNQGYAFLWIGEVYLQMDKTEEALYAFCLSKDYWSKTSPIKALQVQKNINDILLKAGNPSLHQVLDASTFDLERKNRSYLEEVR